MSKTVNVRSVAIGLVLASIVAAGVGAQSVPSTPRPHYLATGLFTVASDEGVTFRVTLDDRPTASPMTVLLQLLDQTGAVVMSKQATLRPGQSTALQVRKPGLFRAYAQGFTIPFVNCDRRRVVGILEIFKAMQSTPPPAGTEEPVMKLLAVDDARGPCFPD